MTVKTAIWQKKTKKKHLILATKKQAFCEIQIKETWDPFKMEALSGKWNKIRKTYRNYHVKRS